MLYDSNGFKLYIYIYLFFKNCPCVTHIYILLALCQNPLNIIFRVVSEVSETTEAVFIGHVQHMARTYPASWTCLAQGLDMFGSRDSSLYKGAERPLRTLGLFSLPLHLLRWPRAL
jgi:hypothetical protein